MTLNASLTLFILALAPVLIGVAAVFGRRLQKASRQVQDQLADATTVAEEGLQGIRVVNGYEAFVTETSKAYQLSLLERLSGHSAPTPSEGRP